jgi:hypothetical protein
MSSPRPETALDLIEEILQAEKALLQAGRAREAAELSSRKLEVLDVLQGLMESGSLNRASAAMRIRLDQISALARENAVLLEAVRNGISSLLRRFNEAGDSVYVGSYGLQGAQLTFSRATGGYIKSV